MSIPATPIVPKHTERKTMCYLHVERVDDKFIVVDDLGRQVALTRSVSVGADYKDVTQFTLVALDATPDCKPHFNNINSDLMMEEIKFNEFTGAIK